MEPRKASRRAYDTLRAEEVPLMLAHVPDGWRPLFTAAVHTAMRKGELFGLRKSDVDLERMVITVARSHDADTTKGGHADSIPLSPSLLPVLRAAMEGPGELVFPGPDAPA